MDPSFARVDALFQAARRLPPEERPAFLDKKAADDSSLRAEVTELLAALESTPDAEPALEVAGLVREAWDTDAVPEGFCGFRIVRRIASGGMGVVYEAEQAHPRRRVALKVLHPGAASEEGRRRFDREAEILARLKHPGIAQVHVFGTAPSPMGDSPFLAMELVDGVPLNIHARGLDTRARLELLAKVCDAVAHAHVNGVIHRDLKPSNILVTPAGEPKVLDFGVARLLDDDPAVRTRTGQIIGTLAYMSPEQATGDLDAVDTRSDVYSLGVLGYEMLCGRLPHDVGGGSLPDSVRRIVEEDPPDPGSLHKALRGDVSLILLKALAKEPSRRYDGAATLAEDIRRHLRDEPILARPPTATYQFRKFVRRHRGLVTGVAATIAALVLGLALAVRAAHEAERQRVRADRSAAEARWAASESLLEAAAADLQASAGAAARRRLERIPPNHRGWAWSYLHARTDTSSRTVTLDVANPRAFVFSPGAASLAVLDDRGPALIDPHSGARTASLLPPLSWRALCLLGGLPAAAGTERSNASWGLLDRPDVASSAAPAPVNAITGSADGSRIALALYKDREKAMILIVDARSGSLITEVSGSHVGVSALAFSPDGRRLAAAGFPLEIRIFDTTSGAELLSLQGHRGGANALAFSPDGRFLLSGADDKNLILWQVDDGTMLHRWTAHEGEIMAAAWNADGTRVASGDAVGVIRVWDPADGACERVLAGHQYPVGALAFRGEDVLVSADAGGVREWNVRPGRDPDVLRYHRGPQEGNKFPYVYAVAYSPDGSLLASAGWDKTVRLVDPATGDLLATLEAETAVFDLAFTPDGRRILLGGGIRELWDADTGQRLAETKVGISDVGYMCSPKGDVFAVSEMYHVMLLDTATLETRARWSDHPYPRRAEGCAWSPDGRFLATVGEDGLYVRAMPAGDIVRKTAEAGEALCVAFDSTGRRIATGGTDRSVRVWETETGRMLMEFRGHREKVYAVAFSPDGSLLVSGANDNTIRIWDLERGVEQIELHGHQNYVHGLAFSPDGKTLASASGDNTVRLWTTLTTTEREALAEAERAARAAVAPNVNDLFARLRDARAVADAVRGDATLSAAERRAALHLVLLHAGENR